MFTFSSKECDNNTHKITLSKNNSLLSFADVIELLETNLEFIQFFDSLLKNCKFPAYFFELPPVTTDSLSNNFEFVLVNSQALANLKPNYSAFADQFKNGKNGVVAFDNLGRDAKLVSPCPISSSSDYVHLAAFVRNAPDKQKHEFWSCVAKELKRSIGKQPIWLSTSGLGVPWLHMRICISPKYYSYKPYTEFN
jgi:hypothetical protein